MKRLPKKTHSENTMNDVLETLNCFISPVNLIKKTEFLESARIVANEHLRNSKEKTKCELYQTEDFSQDIRISDFVNYIGSTAWNILKSQGYKMDNKNVFFESMWCQEYKKDAYMPQHVHPNNGAQLVGFYFLECPKDSSKIVVHDPRAGKVQISIEESDIDDITNASNAVHFTPEAGTLLFTNSWLPHSFTQNKSNKSFKFIHFNIGVNRVNECTISNVEVI